MTAAQGTRERVVELAREELGTVESPAGSNKTEYGKRYGMDGVAWCAMFVWDVFDRAGAELPIKTAYTPALAAAFQAEDDWLKNTSKDVQPGDVVLFYWPSMGRIAHTGIVEAVLPNGDLQTIEGNTDAAGGRSGGRVMRRVRSRATVHPNGGIGVPDYEEATFMAELSAEEQRDFYEKTVDLHTFFFEDDPKKFRKRLGRGPLASFVTLWDRVINKLNGDDKPIKKTP